MGDGRGLARSSTTMAGWKSIVGTHAHVIAEHKRREIRSQMEFAPIVEQSLSLRPRYRITPPKPAAKRSSPAITAPQQVTDLHANNTCWAVAVWRVADRLNGRAAGQHLSLPRWSSTMTCPRQSTIPGALVPDFWGGQPARLVYQTRLFTSIDNAPSTSISRPHRVATSPASAPSRNRVSRPLALREEGIRDQ